MDIPHSGFKYYIFGTVTAVVVLGVSLSYKDPSSISAIVASYCGFSGLLAGARAWHQNSASKKE